MSAPDEPVVPGARSPMPERSAFVSYTTLVTTLVTANDLRLHLQRATPAARKHTIDEIVDQWRANIPELFSAPKPGELGEAAEAEAADPARIAADARMFALLHATDFTGRAWDLFADPLVRHAVARVERWLRTGHIFDLAATLKADAAGGTTLPSLMPTAAELAEARRPDVSTEIAVEVVGATLMKFQASGLAGEGWKPESKASLVTYFLTGCQYSFRDEFRGRRRQAARWSTEVATDFSDPQFEGLLQREADDSAVIAELERHELNQRLDAALAEVAPIDAQILRRKAACETNAAIAATLGITPKAVERRWSRLMDIYPWARKLSRGRKPEKR